jgi:hypothetical protein
MDKYKLNNQAIVEAVEKWCEIILSIVENQFVMNWIFFYLFT